MNAHQKTQVFISAAARCQAGVRENNLKQQPEFPLHRDGALLMTDST